MQSQKAPISTCVYSLTAQHNYTLEGFHERTPKLVVLHLASGP